MSAEKGAFSRLKGLTRLNITGKILIVIVVLSAVLLAVIIGYMLPSTENSLVQEQRDKIKEEVQLSWTVVNNIYHEAQAGEMTEDEAQLQAMKEVGDLRFGDTNAGYFFISDINANMVMHPIKPEMDGKNQSDYKDPTGKAIFVEMANVVKADGDGYVDYMWQYGSDVNRIEPKISYVKGFQPWGWVIGTGVYTTDIDPIMGGIRNQYIILAAILATAIAILIFFISRTVSANIKRLARVADKLSIGDTKQKLEIKSNDEIGLMGKSLSAVINYLWDISLVADRISEGDLTVNVEPKSEKDTLGNAFNKMINKLRELVKTVDMNIDTMATASEQLASASDQSGSAIEQITDVIQQVAKGSTEQTKGIDEVNAALAELSKAIELVNGGSIEQSKAIEQATGIVQQVSSAAEQAASSAQEAATNAIQAADVAKQGSSTVEKTISGIRKINDCMQDIAAKVAELGKHSEEIGGMIAVIDDIASQTNLLALNAAIEAARAGEQGRGFAVVADEVKKLAERTAKETKEISTLVTTVQKGVSESIKASMEGAKQAEEGSELANEAGTALGQILDAVNSMASQIDHISGTAEEMSASANEMVKVIDGVSKIAEQNLKASNEMASSKTKVSESATTVAATLEENSAATEEMSASAEEMTAQVQQTVSSSKSAADMAKELKQAISAFKLDEKGREPSSEEDYYAKSKAAEDSSEVGAGNGKKTKADIPEGNGHGNGNGNGNGNGKKTKGILKETIKL